MRKKRHHAFLKRTHFCRLVSLEIQFAPCRRALTPRASSTRLIFFLFLRSRTPKTKNFFLFVFIVSVRCEFLFPRAPLCVVAAAWPSLPVPYHISSVDFRRFSKCFGTRSALSSYIIFTSRGRQTSFGLRARTASFATRIMCDARERHTCAQHVFISSFQKQLNERRKRFTQWSPLLFGAEIWISAAPEKRDEIVTRKKKTAPDHSSALTRTAVLYARARLTLLFYGYYEKMRLPKVNRTANRLKSVREKCHIFTTVLREKLFTLTIWLFPEPLVTALRVKHRK